MTEHRIMSVVLVTLPVPEVDGKRMLEEWRGGPLITHDVQRDVYAIACSCGENGYGFRFEDVLPVFESHVKRVSA